MEKQNIEKNIVIATTANTKTNDGIQYINNLTKDLDPQGTIDYSQDPPKSLLGFFSHYKGGGTGEDAAVLLNCNIKPVAMMTKLVAMEKDTQITDNDFYKSEIVGTTCTVASLDQDGNLQFACLGDSPVYMVIQDSKNQNQNIVIQLSEDMDCQNPRYANFIREAYGEEKIPTTGKKANRLVGQLEVAGAIGDLVLIDDGLIKKPEYYNFSKGANYTNALNNFLRDTLGLSNPDVNQLLQNGQAKIVVGSDGFAPRKLENTIVANYIIHLKDSIPPKEFKNNTEAKYLPESTQLEFIQNPSTTQKGYKLAKSEENKVIIIVNDGVIDTTEYCPADDQVLVYVPPQTSCVVTDGHGGPQVSGYINHKMSNPVYLATLETEKVITNVGQYKGQVGKADDVFEAFDLNNSFHSNQGMPKGKKAEVQFPEETQKFTQNLNQNKNNLNLDNEPTQPNDSLNSQERQNSPRSQNLEYKGVQDKDHPDYKIYTMNQQKESAVRIKDTQDWQHKRIIENMADILAKAIQYTNRRSGTHEEKYNITQELVKKTIKFAQEKQGVSNFENQWKQSYPKDDFAIAKRLSAAYQGAAERSNFFTGRTECDVNMGIDIVGQRLYRIPAAYTDEIVTKAMQKLQQAKNK